MGDQVDSDPVPAAICAYFCGEQVMNMNTCPVCGKTAMTAWEKLASFRLSCGNCHATLRLHFAAILTLVVILLLASILALKAFGFSTTSVLLIGGMLIAFAVCGLFIPLEIPEDDQ